MTLAQFQTGMGWVALAAWVIEFGFVVVFIVGQRRAARLAEEQRVLTNPVLSGRVIEGVVIAPSATLDDDYQPKQQAGIAVRIVAAIAQAEAAGRLAELAVAREQEARPAGPRHARTGGFDPRTSSVAALLTPTQLDFAAVLTTAGEEPPWLYGPRESEIARPRRLVWLGEGDWEQDELPLEGVR